MTGEHGIDVDVCTTARAIGTYHVDFRAADHVGVVCERAVLQYKSRSGRTSVLPHYAVVSGFPFVVRKKTVAKQCIGLCGYLYEISAEFILRKCAVDETYVIAGNTYCAKRAAVVAIDDGRECAVR